MTVRGCILDDIFTDITEKTTLVYLDLKDSMVYKKKNPLFNKLVNLEHVSITDQLFTYECNQSLLDSISETCKKLRHFEVFHKVGGVVSVKNWKNFENLVHLSFSLEITNDVAISVLNNCSNLKYLDVSMCYCITKRALHTLTCLKNLEYLMLPRGCILIGEIIKNISNVCKKLKHLEMIECLIKLPLALDPLSDLRYLEYLNFSCVEDLQNSTIILIADRCKNLKYLNIERCYSITESALLTLTVLKQLETLNVASIESVTDEFIVRLKNFKYLDFHGCKNITENGIIQVMKQCPDLEYLDIRSTNIKNTMIVLANINSGNPINDIESYMTVTKL